MTRSSLSLWPLILACAACGAESPASRRPNDAAVVQTMVKRDARVTSPVADAGASVPDVAVTSGTHDAGSTPDAGSASDAQACPPVDGGAPSPDADAPMVVTQPSAGQMVVAVNGKALVVYEMNRTTGALALRGSWSSGTYDLGWTVVEPTSRVVYVAGIDWSAGGKPRLFALSIDRTTGALAPLGTPVDPPLGVVHMSLAKSRKFLYLAHYGWDKEADNGVSVVSVGANGALGALTGAPISGTGLQTHAIRLTPNEAFALVPSLGNKLNVKNADGTTTSVETPGKITVFSVNATTGALTKASEWVSPDASIGPRHLEFHPSNGVVYFAAERGNKLLSFKLDATGALLAMPNFTASTFPEDAGLVGQKVADIKIHPKNPRVLYVSNRNTSADQIRCAPNGDRLFREATGANDIAVFTLAADGKPTLLQREETRGFEPRTLAMDPEGKFLIVGNEKPLFRNGPNGVPVRVAGNVAVFETAADGKLSWKGTYPTTNGGNVSWVGVVRF